jgi:hypothetical protein
MAKPKLCDKCLGNINASKKTRNLRIDICTCKQAGVRNAFALHAKMRRAGYMKDRREPRGGTRNKQAEYRDED